MSFPRSQAFEHAEIRVDDLGQALAFCTETLGLIGIHRSDDTIYLGCGYDANYDVALRGGGTGLEHFALRADDGEDLERAAAALAEAGVATEHLRDAEPGELEALRFQLPSGHAMELVVVADQSYMKTYRTAHPVNGISPLDVDHITIAVADIKGLTEFLCGVLGFRISDATRPEGEDGPWVASWLRRSLGHHDIGMTPLGPNGGSLHHLAWAYSGIEHLKAALDNLGSHGHRLELGPGRHPVGANLYCYLWTPGGNRFELCAEGAILNPDTPPQFWQSMADTLDAWGNPAVPPTFGETS